MLPHLVPLATSSHFGSVHTKGAEELNLFSLEYGVQARYGVTNIQQKSSGISSSTETLLQLCDIVASNGMYTYISLLEIVNARNSSNFSPIFDKLCMRLALSRHATLF